MHCPNVATGAVFVSSVALVMASPVPTQAEVYATATTTSSGAEPTFSVANRRRTNSCNQDDRLKAIEAQAWADAGALAAVADQWEATKQWQPAMDAYMGVDSIKSEFAYKIYSALENENKVDAT
ncbi:hypothetical protein B0H10DRAFT_1963646 [Mycena sp. CBHHK59/15]|nr:hypothetical protein B0H10DRAFT_1963646 [Mycena sp. CBHHK59/15]